MRVFLIAALSLLSLMSSALAQPQQPNYMMINGTRCQLGQSCAPTSSASSVTIGSTNVVGGSNGNLLSISGGKVSQTAASSLTITLSQVTSALGYTPLDPAAGINTTAQGITFVGGQATAFPGGTVALSSGVLSLTGAPNDTVTGTTLNKLVKQSGSGKSIIIGIGDTSPPFVGICIANCGTTSSPTLAINGTQSCVFDGSTTAGDYVVPSTTIAGACHDAGATVPASQTVIGVVTSTNVGAGTYSVDLNNVGVMAANSTKVVSTTKGYSWSSAETVIAATIPLYIATASGTIDSVSYYTNGASASYTLGVQINGNNVAGCNGLLVNSASPTTASCASANTFVAGDRITLVTSGITNSPTQSQAQITFH